MSPATPRLRSTSWQNWWMVAMVAASKETRAAVRWVQRRSASSGVGVEQPVVEPVVGVAQTGVGEQLHGLVELAAARARAAPGWRRG